MSAMCGKLSLSTGVILVGDLTVSQMVRRQDAQQLTEEDTYRPSDADGHADRVGGRYCRRIVDGRRRR